MDRLSLLSVSKGGLGLPDPAEVILRSFLPKALILDGCQVLRVEVGRIVIRTDAAQSALLEHIEFVRLEPHPRKANHYIRVIPNNYEGVFWHNGTRHNVVGIARTSRIGDPGCPHIDNFELRTDEFRYLMQ